MRHLLLIAITISVLTSCGQNKTPKLTVIFSNNENINLDVKVDTLLCARQVNLADTLIDMFFAQDNFHLPYYVPTDGIFKNATKDAECNEKNYPYFVKCYEYDGNKRVTSMSVSGSGAANNFTYTYNDKNQVTKITEGNTIFTLLYNTDGTLSELKENNGPMYKKLVFIYE